MSNKTLLYEPIVDVTDEPRVLLLEGRRNGYKFASSDVHDFCASVRPQPGKRYVLVLAMSAGEYYGPNRNGDAFSEGPISGAGGLLITAEQALVHHYKSFEEHGRTYVHHINHNPKNSYGRVVRAFYNWKMHRVELLLEIDTNKARDQFFLAKIEGNDFPGVSMGCRIPYDVCSICGNRAPTIAEYCEHVNNKDPDYGMNRLLSDGRRCFVWNPEPLLFDISFVWRPADRIGYTMKKVAGEMDGVYHSMRQSDPYTLKMSSYARAAYEEELAEKRAVLRKLSDIDKIIDGQIAAESDSGDSGAIRSFVQNYIPTLAVPSENLSPSDAQWFVQRGVGLPGLTQELLERNDVPSAKDVTQVMFAARGVVPTEHMLNAIAGAQGALAGALSEHPEILGALERTGILSAQKIANSLEAELPAGVAAPERKRSLALDRLFRTYVPEEYGVGMGLRRDIGELTGTATDNAPYYASTTQLLHVKDPRSGKVLQTNRLAAEEADLANKKKWLMELAGMSGLTALGLKALHGSKLKALTAPAAIAGVGGVLSMGDYQKVPQLKTEEGLVVPANTEFVEKRSGVGSSLIAPVTGAGALTMLLAHDKAREVAAGTPVMETATQIARENPWEAATGAATGFALTAPGLETALKALLRSKTAGSVFADEDLMPLAAEIGRVIMEYA